MASPKFPKTKEEAGLLYNAELADYIRIILMRTAIPVHRIILTEAIKRLRSDGD